MKYIILSISCLIFFSCIFRKNGEEQEIVVVKQEKGIHEEAFFLEQKAGTLELDSVLPKQNLIQGIWAENEDENALFYIEKDSFSYVDDLSNPLYYRMIDDTLLVYGDIVVKYFIIKLDKDSFWFKTDFYDEITKLYKRK